MSSEVNPHIFREYDIRGHGEQDLSSDLARKLGLAYGTVQKAAGRSRIAVGRDCRLTSDRLFAALTDGLRGVGIDVVELGMVPTPLLYFAVNHFDLDGGIQITGSHNPPEDNGFKMMAGKNALFGDDIQTLRQLIVANTFEEGARGGHEILDPLPAYGACLKERIDLNHTNVKFAVDAGNGAGGPAALLAMDALGLDPVSLLCEPDGRFPVHHPDPSQPENLALLRDAVLQRKLELGIAYDGDADRIGVIDEAGNTIFGDKLMILFARAVLKENPGAAILGEVKCSQTLYDDIAKRGGRPILWKTGHSLIKAKMKEERALLAGEMSGHIFFADRYYGFDDAIYATLRLLEIVTASDTPLSTLLEDVPQTFSTPELRVECPDSEKFAVVDAVKKHFQARREVVDIDGARILFDEGWGLVRASNTQPVLVLRFEASSEGALAAIQDEVEAVVGSQRA